MSVMNQSVQETERKCKREDKELLVFTKGAPEGILEGCSFILEKGKVRRLTNGDKEIIATKNRDLADDMVLLDDNFATIVDAVRNGRTIFDNIRTFVRYLLTTNLAEVFVVFLASLFGYLPIMPVQLLLINFLTDGLPALALGVDPTRKGTMQRKRRRKAEGIMNRKSIYWIMGIGIELGFVLLAIFFIGLKNGLATARTMVFTGFVLYEFVKISVIRYQQQLSWFSNKWLVLATTGCIALQLAILYTPLNRLFHVVPLGLFEWLILLLGAGISWILAMLITKYVVRYTH